MIFFLSMILGTIAYVLTVTYIETNKRRDPQFKIGDKIRFTPRHLEPWEVNQHSVNEIVDMSPTAYKVDSDLFPTIRRSEAYMYKKVN